MGQILARQEEGQDSRRRTISFSSEAPYRRYFGMEILDHAEGAVDLGRPVSYTHLTLPTICSV